MLEAFRQYVEAGLGALPKDRAMELARQLLAQGQGLLEQGQSLVGQAPGGEQVQRLARDLMSWSRASGERLRDMVQEQVTKQVKAMGLATRDDVDDLRRRIRELEARGATKKRAAKRAPAKKRTAKRRTAKKRTVKAAARTGTSGGSGSGA
ncbi:MAG TPA: phasin family protein [Actinomycetota bacterium]|nr:phasin family protein [Actinomycetota bacterium]